MTKSNLSIFEYYQFKLSTPPPSSSTVKFVFMIKKPTKSVEISFHKFEAQIHTVNIFMRIERK